MKQKRIVQLKERKKTKTKMEIPQVVGEEKMKRNLEYAERYSSGQ